jgi:hypothetical protein
MIRIVYNRHTDNGVSVCSPSGWALAAMSCGGYWAKSRPGFADDQIARMTARGVREEVAARYVKAMQFGGCTTAEALEIIRDRDCSPHGYAIELCDDLPGDRWFRDAWRRSHNGGPVSIDLNFAKPIQWRKAIAAVERENKRRAASFELRPLIDLDRDKLRKRISEARDEGELRAIWPKGLMQ